MEASLGHERGWHSQGNRLRLDPAVPAATHPGEHDHQVVAAVLEQDAQAAMRDFALAIAPPKGGDVLLAVEPGAADALRGLGDEVHESLEVAPEVRPADGSAGRGMAVIGCPAVGAYDATEAPAQQTLECRPVAVAVDVEGGQVGRGRRPQPSLPLVLAPGSLVHVRRGGRSDGRNSLPAGLFQRRAGAAFQRRHRPQRHLRFRAEEGRHGVARLAPVQAVASGQGAEHGLQPRTHAALRHVRGELGRRRLPAGAGPAVALVLGHLGRLERQFHDLAAVHQFALALEFPAAMPTALGLDGHPVVDLLGGEASTRRAGMAGLAASLAPRGLMGLAAHPAPPIHGGRQ